MVAGFLRKGFRSLVSGAFAALLLAVLAYSSYGQNASPVGTVWDCVISGARDGVAYLTFSTNGGGVFDGAVIMVIKSGRAPREGLLAASLGSNGLGVR
jgi:hypothetical protein